MPTLFEGLLAPAAREGRDRTAFISLEQGRRTTLSFREAMAQADLLAGRLGEAGLAEGGLLALMAPNCLEAIVALFAASRLNAALVPVPAFFRLPEISKLLRDCQPDLFLLTPHLLPPDTTEQVCRIGNLAMTIGSLGPDLSVSEVKPRSPSAENTLPRPENLAILIYTSGTTGLPKGVMLSNDNLLANAHQTRRVFDEVGLPPEEQVFSGVLPVCHSFGLLAGVTLPLCSGGAAVMASQFNPKMLFAAVQQESITFLLMVPEMYRAMNLLGKMMKRGPSREERLLPSLRVAVSGGAALPQVVAEDFQATYGVGIHQGYGLTETSPVLSVCKLSEPPVPGSSGPPVEGVEYAVVDARGEALPPGKDGALWCSGPNIAMGYYGKPELTASRFFNRSVGGGPAKRWFDTGDRAWLDERGWVYLCGRSDDLIVVNGLNVYPAEIVNALLEHGDVAEALVGRVRSEKHGQEPVAFVVPRPDSTLTEETLRSHLSQRIAVHKIPARILFVDALEKTALGKPKVKEMLLAHGLAAA